MTFLTALARILSGAPAPHAAPRPPPVPPKPRLVLATPPTPRPPVLSERHVDRPTPFPPRRSEAPIDPHGQPFNVQFNRAHRTERDLSELLGLAKGMLSDGVITEQEATYLRAWCANHPDAVACWPANLICARLTQFFAKGSVTDSERGELLDLLAKLVGGTSSLDLGYEAATTLPLDDPAPRLRWPGEVYVFTGRFAYGKRRTCEREVTDRGGSCEENITQRTTVVVIGTFGSRDWAHSNYGGKIQKAVTLRDKGGRLRIVSEDHWATALGLPEESPF